MKDAVEGQQWLVGKVMHAVRVGAYKQGRVTKIKMHVFCS